jgi:hypothetical protein
LVLSCAWLASVSRRLSARLCVAIMTVNFMAHVFFYKTRNYFAIPQKH